VRRTAVEYVHDDPAADCEGVVGLIFAELAGFFKEEEDGETGAQEEDGGNKVGESVWVFGHPVYSIFTSEGRARAKNGGVASYGIC
jgi:hypothetical protein